MIYMGSKLVLGNKAQDDAISRKQILKSLSVQEKLLLTELQKTRENIVDELKRVEFGEGFADSDSIQSTIADYENKISGIENSSIRGRQGGAGTGKTAGFPSLSADGSLSLKHAGKSTLSVSQSMTSLGGGGLGSTGKKRGLKNAHITTGIDMLPSLETFSNRGGGLANSKMMIRLPIFKLPTVELRPMDSDLDHIGSSQMNGSQHAGEYKSGSRGTTGGDSSQNISDNKRVKGDTKQKVLVDLELIAQKELKMLMQFLHITPDDFNILKIKFRNYVKGIDNSKSAKSTFVTVVDKYESIRQSSSNVTLASSGASVSFGQSSFVAGGRIGGGVISDDHSMGSGSLASSMLRSVSVGDSSSSLVSGSKSTGGGRANKKGGNSKNEKSDSLRNELINSMKAMEYHSSKLKEGFATLNGVISISDPKLKSMRYAIAAERMRKALWNMVKFEMLKGFEAWKLAILYIANDKNYSIFRKTLFMKKLLKTLFRIVLSLIHKKFKFWYKYAKAETRRLRKELELRSVCLIQRILRGHIARKRVAILMQNSKYQKMYDATIKIQSVIRGKIIKWKYAKFLKARAQDQATRKIQRIARGMLGRNYFKACWMIKNKNKCVVKIQAAARRRLARKRIAKIKLVRIKIKAATKIQSLMRGFLIRLNIKKILAQKAEVDAAIWIQRLIRGKLARIRVERKRVAIQQEFRHRSLSANLIQAVYRGYSSRVVTKIMLMEKKRIFQRKYDAATMINKTVRGFIGMRRVQKLSKERDKRMQADARQYKEVWSDDNKAYFYLNEETGEALWEPPKTGYTKADGSLVLANGKIIEDNRFKIRKDDDDDEEDQMKKNSNLCSECTERIAIVSCNECGDKYCTKCYKSLHAVGSRRNHVTKKLGPVDCTECEMRLAERFCVSCDEPFCDMCWRKLHARGKRRFHPFQEVSPQGYINSRIFTMDGLEVNNYDLTYSQLREESAGAQAEANWVEAYDDDGNQYWYDEISGASTYEDPFAAAAQAQAGDDSAGGGGEGGGGGVLRRRRE